MSLRPGDDEVISKISSENHLLKQKIEELEKLNNELLESKKIYKSLVDLMPQRLLRKDKNNKILFANKAYLDELGLTLEEAVGKSDEDLFPRHFVEICEDGDSEVMSSGKIIDVEEDHWLRGENKAIPVQVVKAPVENDEGEILGVQAIFWDITSRKKTEDELLLLRNYLSNIIDSMPSALIGVDADCKITQWNKTVAEMTGVSFDSAKGKILSDVFPHLNVEMEKIRVSIETGELRRKVKVPRYTDSNTIYEDITIYPLITSGIEGAVIRIDDVTDKVQLEEMMIQNEKMVSIGSLAAGIAHEINNPLAGMVQSSNVMSRRLKDLAMNANRKAADELDIPMEKIKKYMEKRGIIHMLENIDEAGSRVSDIINNMLSFVRKSEHNQSCQNLEDILDKTLDLAVSDYDLKKEYDFMQIRIIRSYDGNLPSIECDRTKIQQVILNILSNGAQAMFSSGIKKPEFCIRTSYDAVKDMVSMEIEDNGPGMDENIRKRVFEPFFTTKPKGVGTGLGLSVSYFIITENHNGEMLVESQPGSGAKFIIRLSVTGC